MPSIPDIPGKGLVTGTTKRARLVAGAAVTGGLAAAGFVAKRVLGRVNGKGDEAAPTAEASPTTMAVEEKPAPQPKPARPKAPKPKAAGPTGTDAPPKPPKPADGPKPPKVGDGPKEPKAGDGPKPPKPGDKPKPPKAKADKPKAAKPKAAKPKPKAAPKPKGAKPALEPGDRSRDKEPHHALNNPVVDPDETEYPDPFEKREDPRDPVDADDATFGDEPHPQVGSESTSEPPPTQDPEVGDRAKPPRRDNLDD